MSKIGTIRIWQTNSYLGCSKMTPRMGLYLLFGMNFVEKIHGVSCNHDKDLRIIISMITTAYAYLHIPILHRVPWPLGLLIGQLVYTQIVLWVCDWLWLTCDSGYRSHWRSTWILPTQLVPAADKLTRQGLRKTEISAEHGKTIHICCWNGVTWITYINILLWDRSMACDLLEYLSIMSKKA